MKMKVKMQAEVKNLLPKLIMDIRKNRQHIDVSVWRSDIEISHIQKEEIEDMLNLLDATDKIDQIQIETTEKQVVKPAKKAVKKLEDDTRRLIDEE